MFDQGSPEMQTDLPDDGFFTDLANTRAYLKSAFEGFAGTGKTFTAAQVIIGLHRRIGSTKPVVLFDTEKAAKFLLPYFKAAGIRTLHKESRSLADLAETMRRCDGGLSDVVMIDSITHVWENFIEAYKERKNRTRLQFEDWGLIKPAWKKEFSEMFVRGRFHAAMTGRAGFEYSDEKDEETGKRTIVKSGIKMKVEGETAYEPDILVLMDRFEEVIDKDNRRVHREAMVLKDRSTLIDGRVFVNPTYEDFSPAIERILLDATEDNSLPERDASLLIKSEENRYEEKKRREQELEEIQGTMVSTWPGMTAMEKKSKSDALEYAFSSRSWEKISGMSPSQLSAGHERIKAFIQKQQQETQS